MDYRSRGQAITLIDRIKMQLPEGKENYTIETIVGDVTALMDQLGINRALVLGHDWGATGFRLMCRSA
ncbi:MAG: alpha/beta hydrolase [Smithella sp.]